MGNKKKVKKVKIDYAPKFLLDFHNMTEDERKKQTVNVGRPDSTKIYRAITHSYLKDKDRERIDYLVQDAIRRLNRCEHDVIMQEFGTEQISFEKAVWVSNALVEYPPDHNVKILKQALKKIAANLRL